MNGSRSTIAIVLSLLAGVVSVVLRVVPHPANFNSVGALGLFGGAKLRSWYAFALPLGVMALSDLALWLLTGFDPLYSPLHISRAYVYTSFLLYVVIGHVLRKRETWGWIIGASLIGSVQFFVVTNFCEWLFQPLMGDLPYRYARDFSGLAACFAAAVPFFQSNFPWDMHAFVMVGDPSYGVFGTILGDLACTCGLFGLAKAIEAAAEPTPASDAADLLKTSQA